HTITCIATFFCSSRSYVTWHEVTKRRVTSFQVIISIFFGQICRLQSTFSNGDSIFFFLWHPNSSIVSQRLGHQSQFGLILPRYWNTSRVNLRIARVSKISSFFVCFP